MVDWFRALDLKSGGPGFKSSTLLPSGFVLGSPRPRCVNSQLVSIPSVGIHGVVCLSKTPHSHNASLQSGV